MIYYLGFAENWGIKYLEDTYSNLNNYVLSPFNFFKYFYDLLPRFCLKPRDKVFREHIFESQQLHFITF